MCVGEGDGTPLQYSCLENPMDGGAWWAAVHGVVKSQTWLSDFTFTFHFCALEKEMATHSSVLAWKIPGTEELGGLLSLGSHRVGHDWSNLAAAAAAAASTTAKVSLFFPLKITCKSYCKYLLMWEPSFPLLLFVFFNIIENFKKYIIFMYRSLWDWKFQHRRYWIKVIYQYFLKAIPPSATLILN